MDAFSFQFDPPNPQTGQTSNSTPSIQIEELTLPDLMKNQHVQAMYNDWKDASSQVIKASQIQQSLWQENSHLSAEVNSLKNSNQQDLYVILFNYFVLYELISILAGCMCKAQCHLLAVPQ